jgi:hypothetical protein
MEKTTRFVVKQIEEKFNYILFEIEDTQCPIRIVFYVTCELYFDEEKGIMVHYFDCYTDKYNIKQENNFFSFTLLKTIDVQKTLEEHINYLQKTTKIFG